MIGQTLDHYKIESKLGEGGMGVVYQARDTHLNRTVAIKVIPSGKIADPGRKQRFVQEARAASALNHPNIVTIYDIRSQDGTDFIVMERIEGQTLEKLIATGGIRPAEALRYAAQIAGGLAKAHATAILHRDVKPSNIMVTTEGRIKILDFGLAKLLDPVELSPDEATPTMRNLTAEGAVVGTASYMSPEQAEGRQLDGRSDIFSLGAVLYEMVTGRRPFAGDSRLAILSRILREDPTPPAEISPSILSEVEKIILRCLRKDPERRFQTMADLKVALEDAGHELVPGRHAAPAPARRRWAWAALLPVLLAAGILAWRQWRAPQSAVPVRAVPLTSLTGAKGYPTFSPDGGHVAFTWTGPKQNNPDIYVQQIGAGAPLRLTTDPGNDYDPVWSPDGRWIAFLRSQAEAGVAELRLIPPLGGPERSLPEIRVRGGIWVTPPYLAWCPESNCLVVTDSLGEGKPDALFVVSIETGEKRQLTDPQPPAIADTNPAVSPGGNWLVFRRTGSLFTGQLYALAMARGMSAEGEPRRITAPALNAAHPTWMPGGREIVFSAEQGLWRLGVTGDSTPARLPFVGEGGLMPAVSRPQAGRPSRLVYVRSFDDYNIWRVESSASGAPASSPPSVAISSTRYDGMAQLSPDGRQIAFSSNRSGTGEIWLASPDGSNLVQLTHTGAPIATGYPHWSSDGRLIVFHSNFEGQGEIYVIPAAGGKPRCLASHPASDAFPSFSRDGNWIYFTSNRSGRYQTWKVPLSGGDATQVPHAFGYAPLESPDRAHLYYVGTMDHPSPLWRVPVAGGEPAKVLDGVVEADFAVLQKGVYYIDRPAGQGGVHYLDRPGSETRLRYFDFAARRSVIVAGNLGAVGQGLTILPDGRTIFYSRMDSSVDDLMLVENFR